MRNGEKLEFRLAAEELTRAGLEFLEEDHPEMHDEENENNVENENKIYTLRCTDWEDLHDFIEYDLTETNRQRMLPDDVSKTEVYENINGTITSNKIINPKI